MSSALLFFLFEQSLPPPCSSPYLCRSVCLPASASSSFSLSPSKHIKVFRNKHSASILLAERRKEEKSALTTEGTTEPCMQHRHKRWLSHRLANCSTREIFSHIQKELDARKQILKRLISQSLAEVLVVFGSLSCLFQRLHDVLGLQIIHCRELFVSGLSSDIRAIGHGYVHTDHHGR